MKTLLLFFLFAPLLLWAKPEIIKPKVKTPTSFAIVVDKQSYDRVKSSIEAYRDAIERDGLATYILVDEWENAGASDDASQAAASLAAPGAKAAVVEDRRGLTVLIRNALFHRVQLMDLDKPEALGALDKEWGYGVHEWEDALDDFYDEHEYVNTDAKARSAELFMLDEKHENDEHSWHVRQIVDDSDGDHDWAITGTIDLDATQSSGEVVFFDYAVTND